MRKLFGILFLLMFSLCGYVVAQPLSVDEIIQKAEIMAFYQGKDGKSKVAMTITDEQGRSRNREFVIVRYDEMDGGRQKFYVYFRQPSDVRNMVFMVWKNVQTDDDRWLYLPALDLVKRISSTDKRTSFAGSHFLYEDVSGRGIAEDSHELVEETEQFYVVNNIPKDKSSVEFDSYRVWIDKQNFLPVKSQYYQNGKAYRVIEALEIKEVQGYVTVTKAKASDLKTGGFTISEFTNIEYDIGVTDEIFTERYLRQPPRHLVR